MNRKYRKTVIAGNWKMNKDISEAKDFINGIKSDTTKVKWCDIALCVPFICLPAAVKAAKGTHIEIGAQNCHYEPSGAFTGEISCGMLSTAGVKYVIIGHSERREYYSETDKGVNKKVHAALKEGLRPIVCVGETSEIRQAGGTVEFVSYQVKMALQDVLPENARKIVFAYEPLWAIGTGNTATAEQANEICESIRTCIRSIYGARLARSVSILYGGSMNDSNAAELLAQPDIDGGLIGGASLDVKKFMGIINAAKQEIV